jgi:cytochrome c biogenesis protein
MSTITDPERTDVPVGDSNASPGTPSVRLGDAEESAGLGYFFSRIYQFFYSKTVGLIIILAMAAYVVVGIVLIQEPKSAATSPEAREAFLETAQTKYGGWTTILDALGFFHVFSSIGFLVLSAALALSIAACTVHRIPQLWRTWKYPKTSASPAFFDRARYKGTVLLAGNSADIALQTATQVLTKARYSVQKSGNGEGLYAAKNAWGPFGTVAAHASFIMIMAALLISSRGGIDKVLTVPVAGEPVAVGYGNLRIQADTFENVTNAEGRSLDYISHLKLYDGDTLVEEQDVRVNSPLRYDGVNFHQNSFGMAVDVSVADASGTLYAGSVALNMSSTDGMNSVGQFEASGYTVNVFVAASGKSGQGSLEAGQAAFQLVDADGELVNMVIADQGTPKSLEGMDFTFWREREYTGIGVRQDPGSTLMWIGSALLVIGMTMTFAFRPRRIWLRPLVDDSGEIALRFASSDKADYGFGNQFQDLVLQTAAALPEPPKSSESKE